MPSSPYPQSWDLVSGAHAQKLERSGHTIYHRGDGPHHWSAVCSECRRKRDANLDVVRTKEGLASR